jgi:hypothetical protein
VLLFLSRDYFSSTNCRRELECAITEGKPLAIVHEENPGRGGAALDELRRDFDQQSWSWDQSSPELYRDGSPPNRIFDERRIITWHRVNVFQDICLSRIGERLVEACPNRGRGLSQHNDQAEVGLYLPGSIQTQDLRLPEDILCYVSLSNPRAAGLTHELQRHLASPLAERHGPTTVVTSARERSSQSSCRRTLRLSYSPGRPTRGTTRSPTRLTTRSSSLQNSSWDISAPFSTNLSTIGVSTRRSSWIRRPVLQRLQTIELPSITPTGSDGRAGGDSHVAAPDPEPSPMRATHMLLLLNRSTFSDAAGKTLATEVRSAMKSGVQIVLVHETDSARGGCPFSHFFETTPTDLIKSGL